MQPRVSPMMYSCCVLPAANALMLGSGVTYTGGTGMPLAMAISSTTFSARRSSGSRVEGRTCVPPSASATARPPPIICEALMALPAPMTSSVHAEATAMNATMPPADIFWDPRTRSSSRSTQPTVQTTPSTNSISSWVVLRRAAS